MIPESSLSSSSSSILNYDARLDRNEIIPESSSMMLSLDLK